MTEYSGWKKIAYQLPEKENLYSDACDALHDTGDLVLVEHGY
jgi:hypothetical protein